MFIAPKRVQSTELIFLIYFYFNRKNEFSEILIISDWLILQKNDSQKKWINDPKTNQFSSHRDFFSFALLPINQLAKIHETIYLQCNFVSEETPSINLRFRV